MQYGISGDFLIIVISHPELQHKPVLVDLTVEEGTRLKVLYGSSSGFHAVDLDSASVYDIYLPKHAQVGRYVKYGTVPDFVTKIQFYN